MPIIRWIVLGALIVGGSVVQAADDDKQLTHVFIFAGQSNMAAADSLIAGTGKKNLSDAGLQTEADRAAQMTYGPSFADKPELGFVPWGPINGHPGGSFSKATDSEGKPFFVHGPEVGFARALYAGGVKRIAIIKVAANIPYHPAAGEIWPWSKGKKDQSPDYYGQWNRFVRDRLKELEDQGIRYRVAGFAWHQGIDDAINRETAETYGQRLRQLIADLRADYECPKAPFVLARSCNSPIGTPAAMAPIREAQMKVGDTVERAAWIDVDDQPIVNSHHFTAEAQLAIGTRMGQAWLKLMRE